MADPILTESDRAALARWLSTYGPESVEGPLLARLIASEAYYRAAAAQPGARERALDDGAEQ